MLVKSCGWVNKLFKEFLGMFEEIVEVVRLKIEVVVVGIVDEY